MRIVISGGSGFIGTALTQFLQVNGHEIIILSRSKSTSDNNGVRFVKWLGKDDQPEKSLSSIDAIINLAGESINSGRWTEKRKESILHSRIKATKEINELIGNLDNKPNVLINASAIGYYGTSLDEKFTEESDPANNNFLAETTQLWEKEASSIHAAHGIRTVYTRFGVVLDEKEGALPKIANPYRFFAGGKVGSGKQWVSWVHLQDLIRLIAFCLENEEIKGPINVTSPNPVKMDTFGKTLGDVLKRPHWIPAPAFALKALLGEMSVLVLEGQQVIPEKATNHGFTFTYPKLEDALQNIYNS